MLDNESTRMAARSSSVHEAAPGAPDFSELAIVSRANSRASASARESLNTRKVRSDQLLRDRKASADDNVRCSPLTEKVRLGAHAVIQNARVAAKATRRLAFSLR